MQRLLAFSGTMSPSLSVSGLSVCSAEDNANAGSMRKGVKRGATDAPALSTKKQSGTSGRARVIPEPRTEADMKVAMEQVVCGRAGGFGFLRLPEVCSVGEARNAQVCPAPLKSPVSEAQAKLCAGSSRPSELGPARVYLQSFEMQMRGAPRTTKDDPWPDALQKSKAAGWAISLNTTSVQSRGSVDRWTFSPMVTPMGPDAEGRSGMGLCVEALWQASKRYNPRDIREEDQEKQLAWWLANYDAADDGRCPRRWAQVVKFRDAKTRQKTPRWQRNPEEVGWEDPWTGEIYSTKPEARARVYFELYRVLVLEGRGMERLMQYITALELGFDVIVKDLDGPKRRDAATGDVYLQTLAFSHELSEERRNESAFAWGHGYCIGLSLLGISDPFPSTPVRRGVASARVPATEARAPPRVKEEHRRGGVRRAIML